MKVKSIGTVYFILFLTLCFSCKKEIKTVAYEKSTFKIIGGSADDYIYFTKELKEGGWLLFGETKSKGNGGSDIWIVKLDSNKNVIWEETHGGIFDESFGVFPNLSHPFIDKDGNILISGYGYNNLNGRVLSSGLIYKFSPAGKLMNETYLPITTYSNFFANYDIDQLPNGNYTAYGYSYPTPSEHYLAELNSKLGLTPNVVTEYSMSTFSGRLFGNTIKIIELLNDSTIKLRTATLATDDTLRMSTQNINVMIDKTGSSLKSNSNLLKFPDGSTIAMLYQGKSKLSNPPYDYTNDHNLYMLKFDDQNQLLWQTLTSGGGILNENIAICKDGAFLSFYKDRITKYSAFGNLLWSVVVPNGNNNITSVSVNSDESIFVSSIIVKDRKFSADVLLFTLNSKGELIYE